MHLTNLSQVLERNKDLLVADYPLLVNMPDDELANVITQQNPPCQLSFYDSNFELHLAHQKLGHSACQFSAHYQSELTHDLVIIAFPKSKNELRMTLAMLTDCTTEQTRVLIVGENKSGIKSINKIIEQQTLFCEKVDTARHCLLIETALREDTQPFNLNDWYSYYHVNVGNISFKVAALPGVFSQGKLDTGTAILLQHLPEHITGNVLDFGCGAGVIACYIGLQNPDVSLDLADVSALALTSSLTTLALNNLKGTSIATNSLSHITKQYQYVISNPPFHQGIKTHYVATETFLANIKKHLEKKGTLTIVANSFLKYQPILAQAFNKTSTLCVQQGFTVYQAKC